MTEEKPPEKIVLPRSGLVLTLRERGGGDFGNLYRADLPFDTGIRDRSLTSFPFNGRGWLGNFNTMDSLDECVVALDARVLSLRSALLSGAEETVAQAMWTHDEWTPKTLAEADVNNDIEIRAGAAIYRDRARAVISALCGEEGK